MNPIPTDLILNTFSVLLEADLDFRLMRNIDCELPDHLLPGKDIDILLHSRTSKSIVKLMSRNYFIKKPHPLRNDRFLYGVHPFIFFKSKKANFYIDFHFELACRSLNRREWIPLDKSIQSNSWTSCAQHCVADLTVPGLPSACEWIHLLSRCVFDKRQFPDGYIRRIDHLMSQCTDQELYDCSRLVFFNFTETLLKLIRLGNHDQIVQKHLQFKDY